MPFSSWTSRLVPLLLLALTACGEGGAASAAAPRDQLVVGAGADEFLLELNRHRLGMYPLNAGICETLVRLGHDFRVEPGLATRWEYLGHNTFRFTLRAGVTFHDGRPFTAAAVRYSVEHAARTGIGHGFLSEQSVRVVDDTTVEIRSTRPNLRLVEQLVHPSYSMIAPGSDPQERPVCTGPFRFVEYLPGNRLVVARHDRYWGEPARLDRIVFRFLPDDNTRGLALRAGEVDLIMDVHRSTIAGLEAMPGLAVVKAPPGGVMLAYLALRGEPPYTRLAEPAVRRAVALAIDRRALAERILEGHAVPARTVNPPEVLGRFAARVRGVPHDPAEAERLLEEAGWRRGRDGVRSRGGERLRLVMILQPGSVDPAVAQFLQAELRRIGIEVRIDQLDPGAYTTRLNTGQFDLDLELPNQNDANPAFLLGLRWYSRSDVRSAVHMRAGAAFDSLVERALAAPDHQGAQAGAAEAMHLLLDREVGAIPLAGIHRIYAMKAAVRGFTPHPARSHQGWSTVRIER